MNLIDNEFTISLKEYLELYDFKKAMEENKIECSLKQTCISSYVNLNSKIIEIPVYRAKKEIIDEIKMTIDSNDKELKRSCDSLWKQLCDAQAKIAELEKLKDLPKKELMVEQIKRMSLKEIKAWKKEK